MGSSIPSRTLHRKPSELRRMSAMSTIGGLDLNDKKQNDQYRRGASREWTVLSKKPPTLHRLSTMSMIGGQKRGMTLTKDEDDQEPGDKDKC